MSFDSHWHYIQHRNEIIVQVKEELEHVYNLMEGCRSYLEVGTAEGNSMYALSHALSNKPSVVYVDYGEAKIEKKRNEVIDILKTRGISIRPIHGCSHDHGCIKEASYFAPYDVVMIDAGHSFADVVADATAYGGMASKYILFHDIMLDGVKQAFDWYTSTHNFKNVSKFISPSSPYGYGIIKL